MDRGPVETRGKIRRRATAILRTRVDEYACLGVVERNDVDPNETSVTIKDVDRESMKYRKTEREEEIRYAIDGHVGGYFCPGSGSRTYPH